MARSPVRYAEPRQEAVSKDPEPVSPPCPLHRGPASIQLYRLTFSYRYGNSMVKERRPVGRLFFNRDVSGMCRKKLKLSTLGTIYVHLKKAEIGVVLGKKADFR